MDQIAFLTQRVWRLEQELARLKGEPLESIVPEAPAASQTPSEAARPAAAIAAGPSPAVSLPPVQLETELVGTWFARIGAVALLIGAGFAFKYGIDRGLIGPAARVASGVAAGVALVIAGEAARLRTWERLAQAVAAAGVGLLYVSIWAAYNLYDLIDGGPAFAVVSLITVGSTALAIFHRWEPLAALATIGGFLGPLLVGGRDEPAALYTYVLILDAGVLAVAGRMRWPSLDVLAFVGSWGLFAAGAASASTPLALGYATALFAVLSAPVAQAFARREDPNDDAHALVAALNIAAYAVAGFALLSRDAETSRGIFLAAVGAAHFAAGAVARSKGRARATSTTLLITGEILLAGAVPLLWTGLTVPVVWTLGGLALATLGATTRLGTAREAGAILVALSLVGSVVGRFHLGASYDPERLLASAESLMLILQIAAMYVLAAVFSFGPREEWETALARGAVVGANVLTVAWMSFEAIAHRGAVLDRRDEPLQFTLTAIWSLYAAVLMIAGIAGRWRPVRLMSITLFGAAIAKAALIDLWLLETGYRVLAFIGLGAILLLASLSYHRFAALIFEDDEGAP